VAQRQSSSNNQSHIEGVIRDFPTQYAQKTMSQKNEPTTQVGVAAAHYFFLELAMPKNQSHLAKI